MIAEESINALMFANVEFPAKHGFFGALVPLVFVIVVFLSADYRPDGMIYARLVPAKVYHLVVMPVMIFVMHFEALNFGRMLGCRDQENPMNLRNYCFDCVAKCVVSMATNVAYELTIYLLMSLPLIGAAAF